MMKKSFTTLSLLLCFYFSYGQKEYDNWLFARYTWVSFVSGNPVNAGGSALYTDEGCSSISDTAGNLLFYTNGETVFNSSHLAMPNGSGLKGGSSASESALIIHDPANTNLYYIFTVAQVGGAFCYSKVDMTLLSGKGNVTVKNIQLLTP